MPSKFLFPFFLVCLLTSSGCSSKSPTDLPKEFEGTWDVLDSKGAKVKNATVVFTNDTFDLTRFAANIEDAKSSPSLKTSFNVNNAEKPAHINFVYLDGDNLGKSRLGIYALEGKDKLKIAIAELDAPRPTDFEAKDTVMVLMLEKRPPEPGEKK